jgi:hypothetical protein
LQNQFNPDVNYKFGLLKTDTDFAWYLCEEFLKENCKNYFTGKWQLMYDTDTLHLKLRLKKLKEFRQDAQGFKEFEGTIRQTLDVPILVDEASNLTKVTISAFGNQNLEFVKPL